MQLTAIIESLLFASRDPLTTKVIAKIVRRGAKIQLSALAEAEAEAEDSEELEENESERAGEIEASVDDGGHGVKNMEGADEGEAQADAGEAQADAGEVQADAGEVQADEGEAQADADEGEVSLGSAEVETLEALSHTKIDDVAAAIAELSAQYDETARSFVVVERAGGWKLYSRPEYGDWIRELFPERKAPKLSPPALETLAIIAYRQPVTKASVEAVRGVAVDGVVHTLVERGLVHIAGRADLPGRPLLYETTPLFLEHFGIKEIDDLPNAAELRRVPLPEPEAEEGKNETAETQEELALDGEGEPGAAEEEEE